MTLSLYKNKQISTKQIAAVLLLTTSILSGCSSTSSQSHVENKTFYQRMDTSCVAQVENLQQGLKQATVSQHLTLANAAEQCVSDIPFMPKHPDNQLAMQFSALAFVNFVNAGDMQAASNALDKFRARFPQQDLLFADFSSFVDTATVLIKQQDLSEQQLTLLNINPTLRGEIKRQRKWSLN